MLEKPTKAIRRPSLVTTRGFAADARLPPAPTAVMPSLRTCFTVSSSAWVP
jgi:hypothetical protein